MTYEIKEMTENEIAEQLREIEYLKISIENLKAEKEICHSGSVNTVKLEIAMAERDIKVLRAWIDCTYAIQQANGENAIARNRILTTDYISHE